MFLSYLSKKVIELRLKLKTKILVETVFCSGICSVNCKSGGKPAGGRWWVGVRVGVTWPCCLGLLYSMCSANIPPSPFNVTASKCQHPLTGGHFASSLTTQECMSFSSDVQLVDQCTSQCCRSVQKISVEANTGGYYVQVSSGSWGFALHRAAVSDTAVCTPFCVQSLHRSSGKKFIFVSFISTCARSFDPPHRDWWRQRHKNGKQKTR